MKKVMAIILSLLLIASLITVPTFASDISVEVTGRRTSDTAVFSVGVKNAGKETSVVIYLATSEKDSTFKKLEKFVLKAEAESESHYTYAADISSGSAGVYVWNNGMVPFASMTSEKCEIVDSLYGERISVTGEDVWASNLSQSSLLAENAVDGVVSTIWGTTKANDNITLYLGGDYILSNLKLAFSGGNNSEYVFSAYVSDDGENFTPILENKTALKSSDLQNFDAPAVRARYLRITMNGVNSGTQKGIGEIEVYGFKDTKGEMLMVNGEAEDDWLFSAMDEMSYTDYKNALGNYLYAENDSDGLLLYDKVDRSGVTLGDELAVKKITASQTPESNHTPSNTIDNNASTIWTASGVTDAAPARLVVDLGSVQSVGNVGIAFDLGDTRTYNYSVEVSSNGTSYTTVVSKRQAANTNDIQSVDILPVDARYVRFTMYARSDSANNGWVRVSEIKLFTGDIEGAGGVIAQKALNVPEDRDDFEITFDLTMYSDVDGETANAYFSGVSITDDTITGGGDLDNYAAIQLRFDGSGDTFSVKQMVSNYFNEGYPINLFTNTFNKDEKVRFSLLVSPLNRTCYVTVTDSENSETQLIHFTYSDGELTRNSSWTWLEASNLVFNTGAGSKNKMLVTDLNLRHVDRRGGTLTGSEPVNGIVRLEATRLSTYPTANGDYYGRYVYHSGEDSALSVAADKNPAVTRFVERRGLIGTGVSLESVTMPGYFIVAEMGDAYYLKKLENTGQFYANATFYKEEAENVGYYTGDTYTYRSYLQAASSDGKVMENKYLYDSTSDYKTGTVKPWKMWAQAQATFYLRNEASAYASDNFYGNSIGSQWWTNYPWKKNNPTNDSYNFTALITKNNVIVEKGELLLKATQIASNAWPTDSSGETGKQYNGDFGRNDWKKWQGYVGVVSIQNKVYNKQCYLEGSFKQPDSPIGYWNAFWLAGRDSWPPEIDVFETLSSKYGANAWHTAIHGEGDKNNLFGKQTSSVNVNKDYHTFALDWGYDYVKFYVDGKLFQRGQNHDTINFQKNMRLILNTGIGGWENEPDSTMVWDDGLRCKYIRTFQYN